MARVTLSNELLNRIENITGDKFTKGGEKIITKCIDKLESKIMEVSLDNTRTNLVSDNPIKNVRWGFVSQLVPPHESINPINDRRLDRYEH